MQIKNNNINKISVIKASGEREKFSIEKYKNSVKRTGLSDLQINKLIEYITPFLYDGITTNELYKKTFNIIKKEDLICASKYSLKSSLRLLGPTGFPFEKFVAEILNKDNYKVKIDLQLKGKCVEHEIDILAKKYNNNTLVEVKFHSQPGYKSTVKVPLYIKSRFNDLTEIKEYNIKNCLIVTNTKFTQDAIDYSNCVGISLIAWGYPKDNSIDYLINKYKLYPVTAIAGLSLKNKKLLINNGLFFCKDLINKDNIYKLKNIGINNSLLNKIVKTCSVISNNIINKNY